jgi:PAS domain S-box-containing protein
MQGKDGLKRPDRDDTAGEPEPKGYMEVPASQAVAGERRAGLGTFETSILRAIPHAVIGVKERIIIFANQAVEAVFGWKPEELMGKTTRVLYRSDEEYEEIGRRGYPRVRTLGTNAEELVCRRRDGSDILCRVSVTRVAGFEDENAAVAVYEDITTQVRLWEALFESEEKYRNIYEKAVVGMFQSTPEGRFLTVNNAMARAYGYSTPEEMLSIENIGEQVWAEPEGRETYCRLLEENGYLKGFELQELKKDGSKIWMSLDVRAVHDESGRLACYEGTAVDITARKLAEEALRESEQRFRDISDNIADWIWEVDSNGAYTYCSERAEDILGYPPEELIGKRPYDVIRPDEIRRVKRDLKERWNARAPIRDLECWHVRKDGTDVCIYTNALPVFDKKGEFRGYRGVDKDITERKTAEQNLQESEEKFRLLFEKSADPILQIDGGTFVDCNQAALNIMGCSAKQEVVGKHPSEISPIRQPDGRLSAEKAREMINAALENGTNHFEWVHRDARNEDFWVDVSLATAEMRGKPIMYGVWRDIKERKQAEAQLKESEERYRTAIESSHDGVALMRGDRHVYVNQRFLDIFGYDRPDQLLGKDHSPTVHPDDRERVRAYNRARQSGQPAPSSYEFTGMRSDGTPIQIETSVAAVTFQGEPATLVYVRDITARKKAEEEKAALEQQLRQSQKMEAIGILAGGVAHDFNNVLTVLIGCGGLLRMKMARTDPLRVYVDQILASSERAAGLTQSLLAFSRKQQINLQPVKFDDVIKDTAGLLKRLITEDIDLQIALGSDNVAVMADVTQVDEVLMNITGNARDAMPKGGVVRIETAVAHIDQGFIRTHGYGEPGDYVLLSISDTGTGMDEVTKEHIFEPFFTTKEVGKGTGLGLSTVYGIVKQHNGYITVSSRLNEGTRFDLYFPIINTKERVMTSVPEEIKGGNQTILIAEDQLEVRKLTTEILRTYGYRTIEAADGEQALREFKKHKDEIELVILDVVMPKKNGKEVFEEIRRMQPGIRVLFVSGYTGDVIIDKGIQDEKVNFLAKPLSASTLLKKVHEVFRA